MWIKEIRFYCYRNIHEQKLELFPGLNVLVGHNGQGKTNFIEGIFLSLTGHPFRFASNNDLLEFGQKESMVCLKMKDQETFELQFVMKEGRKSLKLNGKRITPSQLSSQFPVLLFSPESLAFIKEGSGERRDLIDDFLLMSPMRNYGELYDEYFKILKSRNRILKGIAEGSLAPKQGEDLLLSYEERFLECAAELSFHRIQGIIHIMNDFKKMAREIYPQPVDISVDYLISDKNAISWSKESITQSIKNRLNDLRAAEKSLGSSLVGPHKHEVRFLVNNKDSRTFCSQGQQRALILAFKLAQLMYHKRVYDAVPVLFLDDVLSELDSQSRENLIKILNETEGQIFLTTTDEYLCRDLKNESQRFIKVNSGKFSYL